MRSASRTSSAASAATLGVERRDAGLEIAHERAEDRVRRRQRPLRERRHRPITNPDVHEVRGEDGLDLVRVQVQVVATDAPQLDVEHEIGVGVDPHPVDEVDLAGELADIELQPLEPGPARP